MANPFLSLFPSEEDPSITSSRQRQRVCTLLTRIFLFSASDYSNCGRDFLRCLPQFIVQLPQLTKDEIVNGRSGELTLENYSIALSERILLASSDIQLLHFSSELTKGKFIDRNSALQTNSFTYLAECYSRADHDTEPRKSRVEESNLNFSDLKLIIIKQCQREIVKTAAIILRTKNAQTSLMEKPHQSDDFDSLLSCAITPGSSIPIQFFYDIAQTLSEDFNTLKIVFEGTLQKLYSSVTVAELSTFGLDNNLNMLEFFSSHSVLSKVLINYRHWLPIADKSGRSFETQTILGKFLSPSSIAVSPVSPSSYFPVDNLYQSVVDQTTTSLQFQLDHLTTRLYKIFDALFRACPESRRALLQWLVRCFENNSDRGKMASRLNRVLGQTTQSSDGFFLNLSWIMLRLCSPFLTLSHNDKRRGRVSNIDVTYCAALNRETAETVDSGGPLIDFSKEAKLAPSPEADVVKDLQTISPNVPFNFVTHCFFLTHKCLILGLTQVINKYQDIRRALSQLHGLVEGLGGMEPPPGHPLSNALVQYRMLSSQLFGIKAHALNPKLIELCLSFYSTTAEWMVQLVVTDENATIPKEPLPPVRMIPECLVENMSNIVMVLREMNSQLTISSSHHICQYLSFTTIFMRSHSFILNPHIRAKLAQLIQLIIHKDENSSLVFDSDFHQKVFASHTLATKHFVFALLSIFIDIEHTGDSMEFEDKFMYRLPIYEILEFVWNIPEYRPSINILAKEVCSDVSQNIPIFMRFMNMMINDAIVQLDEGLENLATIKEIEDLMHSEEWNTLTDDRRKEKEEKLKEAKMYASNRNQMASKTLNALNFITKDTRQPFVIPGIVDRMAAMLNYVLKLLVGKGNVNFKVKDSEKYHFYPRDFVKHVIAIYINLGHEDNFCKALPKDGRSFSLQLFLQAERVIRLICENQIFILDEWKKLHTKVKKSYNQLSIENEAFENAPEEFLDPITNELMIDPVTLPTSGMITDRSTIRRHLLSDQQDPFNRAPLTADMLESNKELQDRIMAWKQERMT